jgi:hypothetical protein
MESPEHHALDPRVLAQAVDHFIEARWRGEDRAASSFAVWFEAHWSEAAPPEPEDPPDAASVLAGSGGGIRWYLRDEAIRGYVARRESGCYLVPRDDIMPAIAPPWDASADPEPGTDRLLRHTLEARDIVAFPSHRRGEHMTQPDAVDGPEVVASALYLETAPAAW